MCVFTYALLVITMSLPAVQLGENGISSQYVNDTRTFVKSFPDTQRLMAYQPKMKKAQINSKKATKKVVKKVVKKPKPVVKKTRVIKHVVKKVVVKKVSRAYEGRVLMTAFGISSYTAANYDTMLKGTGLAGYGDVFKKMELKYGVNGLFAIAVALHESALGNHPLKGNNYFGMIGMHFDSVSDNIYYFGHLMSGGLYKKAGLTTIYSIGSRYCVGNTWPDRVLAHMRQRAHMVH